MTFFASFPAVAAITLLHATALALVTGLICRTAGRRLRPSIQAWLWTLVLVKFFVPPVLPGEVGFSSWLRGILSVAPASGPRPSRADVLELVLAPAPANALARIEVASPESPVAAPGTAGAVLFGTYVLALLLFASRPLLRWHRTWRRVRSLPEATAEIVEEVTTLARRIGLRRAPRVFLSPTDSSPFVTGVVRTRLVLPRSLAERSPTAREPLLLHELAHVKRGDLAVRALQNVARLLFFFWPPLWWVCRSIERAAELACDEWALTISSVEPRVYASELLDVVRRSRENPIASQALALAHNGRFLEERFEMILNHRSRSPRLSGLALAAVLVWAAFSLGGGAAAEEKKSTRKEADVLFVRRAPGPAELPARWSTLMLLQPSADRDGSGDISDAEAMAFAESRSAADKTRLAKLAPEADVNRDQALDARELYDLLNDRLNGGLPFGRVPIIINPPDADTNRDGQISEAEAKAYIEAHEGDPVEFRWETEVNEGGEVKTDRKVIRHFPG